MIKIVAVLTSFNRKDKTLSCLTALTQSARLTSADVSIVLVDDASTDGTAQAVRGLFPSATVIEGSGDLYWNRGMHLGMECALQMSTDYVLWLNDDTLLVEQALSSLLEQERLLKVQLGRPVVLVGATSDECGHLTYGGASSLGYWRRFAYRRVWSNTKPLPCSVMNGNCVLIPMEIVRRVGNIDRVYEHAMGDTDYALRAGRAGFPVFAAAGIVGECSVNSKVGTFADRSLPMRQRWHLMMSRKGLPWRSWLRFTRRHGGLIWPLYFVWPYARLIGSSAYERLFGPKARKLV